MASRLANSAGGDASDMLELPKRHLAHGHVGHKAACSWPRGPPRTLHPEAQSSPAEAAGWVCLRGTARRRGAGTSLATVTLNLKLPVATQWAGGT